MTRRAAVGSIQQSASPAARTLPSSVLSEETVERVLLAPEGEESDPVHVRARQPALGEERDQHELTGDEADDPVESSWVGGLRHLNHPPLSECAVKTMKVRPSPRVC